MKWSVHRWRCRQNYRDGCQPVWMVTSPDEEDWISFEFDTWDLAMEYVNRQLAAAGVEGKKP